MRAAEYRVSYRRQREERDPPSPARPEALVLELVYSSRALATEAHIPPFVFRVVRVIDVHPRLPVGSLNVVGRDGMGPEQAPQEPPVDGGSEADQVRTRTGEPDPARYTIGPSASRTQPLAHRGENRPRHVLADVKAPDLIEQFGRGWQPGQRRSRSTLRPFLEVPQRHGDHTEAETFAVKNSAEPSEKRSLSTSNSHLSERVTEAEPVATRVEGVVSRGVYLRNHSAVQPIEPQRTQPEGAARSGPSWRLNADS